MASTVPNQDVFMFDRAAETMPRGDLAALQLHRLKATVERAYAKAKEVNPNAGGTRTPEEGVTGLRLSRSDTG
jgi:hypothetical protein